MSPARPRGGVIATGSYKDLSRMGGGLSRRQGDRERLFAVQGGVDVVSGVIEIAPLEATEVEVAYPVTFPVRFLGSRTDFPVVAGSGNLPPGQSLTAGQFPKWNVGGANFIYEESPGGSRRYSGCDLVIVVSGPIGMRSFATWFAIGRALVNPDRPTPAPGIIG